MTRQVTYADAGVNIDLGKDVSKILYNAARQTWGNRKGRLGEVITPFDDFSGVRAIDVSGLPSGTLLSLGSDGEGTKAEIAERKKDFRVSAYNLIAMCADDAVVRGAEPVLFTSVLDVRSLTDDNKRPFLDQIRQLALGYIGAAQAADLAVINGEVAELGARIQGYGPFNYNWGGSVAWFAHKDRMFRGNELQEGDSLVGLQETEFRSNGLSLVRKIMKEVYGDDWHHVMWKRGKMTLGDMVLTPSTIYTKAVVDMFGGWNLDREPKAKIHGVAHITGGGLPEKLGRLLQPSGFGAIIDNPMEPSEFMRYVQAYGNVSDEEAYRTWNMGQGMIIATPGPDAVQAVARQYGINSKEIGRVTREPGIRIKNRGALNPEATSRMTDESLFKKGPEWLVYG